MDINDIPKIWHTLKLVNTAFMGKYDKGGMPYIFHLTHVAEKFRDLPAQTVALLHDLIEDCSEFNLNSLRQMGYPEEIVEAVDAITKREGETYGAYLLRVKANGLTTRVKIEDIRHNMDLTRLNRETYDDEQWKRIMERYSKYVEANSFLQA